MGPRDEDLAVLVSVTKTGVEPCWLVHYIVIAVSYAAWIMKKNKKERPAYNFATIHCTERQSFLSILKYHFFNFKWFVFKF